MGFVNLGTPAVIALIWWIGSELKKHAKFRMEIRFIRLKMKG